MIVRPATLAALLFAVLALVAAGCGGDDETPSSSGAEATTAATTAPTAAATEDADAGEEGKEGEGSGCAHDSSGSLLHPPSWPQTAVRSSRGIGLWFRESDRKQRL